MLKQLAAAALSLMAVFGVSSAAQAETVLEKVARTGTLTLGTSLNIIPYAYVDSDQNVVGYSMDVVERIRLELEALLGREVVLGGGGAKQRSRSNYSGGSRDD
jgi:polar amino acid transport system substrate-binding protein